MPPAALSLDEAVAATATGDIWLFRGKSVADRAIRAVTNAPVNHVGMTVAIDDLPPLLWHAELGRSLPDVWTGERQRGVQLHLLRDAVTTWNERYGTRCELVRLSGTNPPRVRSTALIRPVATPPSRSSSHGRARDRRASRRAAAGAAPRRHWRNSSAALDGHALAMIDATQARGFAAETCAMDRGDDYTAIYEGCAERDCLPVIPVRQTPAVKQGKHKPPTCDHGEWRFAGADYGRKATKWRCPTGECKPASVWIKADRLHPLIPRESLRFKKLYRGRSAVEREFGRLKHEWALSPLRVRGLDRVRLHADLTILAKLACALARARAVPLTA